MLGKSTNKRVKTLIVAGLAMAGFAWPMIGQAQVPAQSSGETVADAARKSRADKNNAPKNKKVYTDEDVSPAPAASTAEIPVAPPPADGTPAPGAATGAATPPDKNDEKAWRERFKLQHDKITRAEKELDVLQREEDKAQVQYYPDPTKALSEGYSRKDINEKDTKIAAKKQEIAQLKQGLDDLEDQLRKSGGDIGWSR